MTDGRAAFYDHENNLIYEDMFLKRKCSTEFFLATFSQKSSVTAVYSPIFCSDEAHNVAWRIIVRKCLWSNYYIFACLQLVSCNYVKIPFPVQYVISIICANAEIIYTENRRYIVDKDTYFLYDSFIDLKKKRRKIKYNGPLTLYCEVSYIEIPQYIKIPPELLGSNMSDRKYDITFNIEDKEIKAHKAALATVSPVFNAMFSHHMLENRTNVVKILDFTFEAFEMVIKYIYTGEINNIKLVVDELLYAADKYDIKGLKNACANALWDTVTNEAAFELLAQE